MKRAARVRVTPEAGEPFTLSLSRATQLGLMEGGEFPEGLREEIMQELRAACMQRCGTLLGSRDYSVQRLRTKLTDAGYPPSVIEDCIEKLSAAHYLDDLRYAQVFVRTHLRDRSLLRIRHDLMERGIPEETVEEALGAIREEADPDEAQLEQIRRLLRKRGYDPAQADSAQRRKAMAAMHRKGYSPELIRRAVFAP